MEKFDYRDYIDFDAITTSWKDLGDVSDKVYFFKDSIIRNDYLKNEDNYLWLKLSDGLYFFKERGSKESYINEFLGERVSLYLNIPSVHYEPARLVVNNKIKYGLLSKWRRKEEKEYFSLSQVLEKDFDYQKKPLEFLNKLETIYPNQPIATQMRDFIAREYYTMDFDRLAEEIVFEKSGNTVSIGYLADYEDEFIALDYNLGVPFYYDIDIDNLGFQRFLLKDERLRLSFQKTLNIPLMDMVDEIKKIACISDYDMTYYKFWQESQKKAIKKILSFK